MSQYLFRESSRMTGTVPFYFRLEDRDKVRVRCRLGMQDVVQQLACTRTLAAEVPRNCQP